MTATTPPRGGICFCTTVPLTVHAFLRRHIAAARERWPVTVVTGRQGLELLADMGEICLPVAMARQPAPPADLAALCRLIVLFRRHRFQLVHSVTPKMGFLAMHAARCAGVPVRLHTFTGQVWVTKEGWGRKFYRALDRRIAAAATEVFADSPSQLAFLVEQGVVAAHRGRVLGSGSIAGVDGERFRPDPAARREFRQRLAIGGDQPVVLFLGRLNRDKGVMDLVRAFARLAADRPSPVLLLVGPADDLSGDELLAAAGAARERIRLLHFTPEPERVMAAADIFCLPSYREGFGQVLIEAGACGVPAVASRIYGITDAVVDGVTGCLFPPGDVPALTGALARLVDDDDARRRMGRAARERVRRYFSAREVTAALMACYQEFLDGTRMGRGHDR